MKKEYRVYVYCDPRFTNKGKGYRYKFGNKGKIKLKYRPFYIGAAKGEGYRRHLIKGASSTPSVRKKIMIIRKNGLEPMVIIIKNFNLKL